MCFQCPHTVLSGRSYSSVKTYLSSLFFRPTADSGSFGGGQPVWSSLGRGGTNTDAGQSAGSVLHRDPSTAQAGAETSLHFGDTRVSILKRGRTKSASRLSDWSGSSKTHGRCAVRPRASRLTIVRAEKHVKKMSKSRSDGFDAPLAHWLWEPGPSSAQNDPGRCVWCSCRFRDSKND